MDLNDLLNGVTFPAWAVAVGGVAVFLLLLMVIRPRSDAGGASGLSTLAQLALVAVIAGAAYFGLKQFEDNARLDERRAIEERAANLIAQANQPGSVLGCLNAAVTPVLDEACEKTIFASPDRLASAVGMTTERLALLWDATNFSAREIGFADRFEHLRKSLEADQFGIVAHVLATEHKCIPDSCTRFKLLRDVEKVKANLTARKFEELITKYSAIWTAAKAGIDITNAPAAPPVNTIGGEVNENELPTAQSAIKLPPPSGETSTSPVVLPDSPASPQPAPVTNTKKKDEPAADPVANTKKKDAPASAAKKKGPTNTKSTQPAPQTRGRRPPEPVGGLPRVTARGAGADSDEEGDTEPPAPQPPAQQTPQALPFPPFGR